MCWQTICLQSIVTFISLISGATTTDLPPGVLYRVKASYKYQAEDVDELAFEVGEVINVVEYEDTEDQVSFFYHYYFFSVKSLHYLLFLIS